MRKDLTLKNTVGGLDFVSSFLEKITKERKPKKCRQKNRFYFLQKLFVCYFICKVHEVIIGR